MKPQESLKICWETVSFCTLAMFSLVVKVREKMWRKKVQDM